MPVPAWAGISGEAYEEDVEEVEAISVVCLAVLATRWAMEHLNAGVVTAWCLKPLLGLYVDACGFEYEPPARAGFDDDDGGDVCCRAWADRWRPPPT